VLFFFRRELPHSPSKGFIVFCSIAPPPDRILFASERHRLHISFHQYNSTSGEAQRTPNLPKIFLLTNSPSRYHCLSAESGFPHHIENPNFKRQSNLVFQQHFVNAKSVVQYDPFSVDVP